MIDGQQSPSGGSEAQSGVADPPPHRASAASGAGSRVRVGSLLKIVLEVGLISAGVFLGLAGEQWRENAEHRAAARESLRRFRAEIDANRKGILAVHEYHTTLMKSMGAYLAADAQARKKISVKMKGLQPVRFQHSAWDLALATQSLADIDPELAFTLARIYNLQDSYAELTRGVIQSLYINVGTMFESPETIMAAGEVYFQDITLMEPNLLRMYDEVLPRIDGALGEAHRSQP